MLILGFSGGLDPIHSHRRSIFPSHVGHDSAAALIDDGVLVAAIEEERLNRIKHTNKAATSAMKACLALGKVRLENIDHVALPWIEPVVDAYFARSMETAKSTRELIHETFIEAFGEDVDDGKLVFVPHHFSHAVSAHYYSGFDNSLVLTLDGAGDLISGGVYSANGHELETLHEFSMSQSLGGFYLQATEFLGFRQFDEYKVMGLAPYGDKDRHMGFFRGLYSLLPNGDWAIESRLIDRLCGLGPRRGKGEPITQFHKDVAASLQCALEDIVFHALAHYQKQTGHTSLCLAGGVAHNCTLNGKLLYSRLFKKVFVQPASHDAGLALGAAAYVAHTHGNSPMPAKMNHAYLGVDIGEDAEIAEVLRGWGALVEFSRESNIVEKTARLLADGHIIGWAQGRAEFGPRALGNRSILADPRPAENRDIINKMVKKREAFRPFAPAVLEEHAHEFFVIPDESPRFPFMTYVLNVQKDKQGVLCATTHVDGTARVQTVSKTDNLLFWKLIEAFGQITGTPVLLNTSFNNNAEPIVDSVTDAIVSFLTTDLHYLIIGNYLVSKRPVGCLGLLPFSPQVHASCALTATRYFKAHGEAAWMFEIQRNYDSRFTLAVSPALYKILAKADGLSTLEGLLKDSGIGEENWEGLLGEVRELWAQRAIILNPPLAHPSDGKAKI